MRESAFNYGFAAPQLVFAGTYTRGPLDNAAAAPMGQGMASLLYGIPSGGTINNNASSAQHSSYWGFFIQDDWRVSSRFTVNIGLRHEYETPVSEPPPVEKSSDWHLSAYADLAYLLDFNFPENHLWRSRTTSQRVNELAPNMGFLNLTKEMTTDSRWRWKSASKAVTTQKPLAFLQDEPRVERA